MKGELFIQQTEEMATIEQLTFEHDTEIFRLTGEQAELIASIREKDIIIAEQGREIKKVN